MLGARATRASRSAVALSPDRIEAAVQHVSRAAGPIALLTTILTVTWAFTK